jgi:hypothetical protein
MGDIHSFENTVVAVLSAGSSSEALEQLSAAGYEYEVMEGESGSKHLDAGGKEGFWAALKRAAAALGDETRVLNRLDSELAEGNIVVSVDISGREGKQAVSILREHGGEFIWRFGDWTFTPIEI